jgi:hypothetical protein
MFVIMHKRVKTELYGETTTTVVYFGHGGFGGASSCMTTNVDNALKFVSKDVAVATLGALIANNWDNDEELARELAESKVERLDDSRKSDDYYGD